MFGHAESVIDGRVVGLTVQPGGVPNRGSGDPGEARNVFGRIRLLEDACLPRLEGFEVATFAHVILVDQSQFDNRMGDGIDDGHIGAGE